MATVGVILPEKVLGRIRQMVKQGDALSVSEYCRGAVLIALRQEVGK